jgi:hypothetical protein
MGYNSTYLSFSNQDAKAKEWVREILTLDDAIFDDVLMNQNLLSLRTGVSTDCIDSVVRFACGQIFPMCDHTNTGQDRLVKVCASECLAMKGQCSSYHKFLNLTCDGSPSKEHTSTSYGEGDITCFIAPMKGFFPPSVSSGPYDVVPFVFGGAMVFWVIVGARYIHNTFKGPHSRHASFLSKTVAFIPILKVMVLSSSIIFWGTCVLWNMCSFWFAILWINANLMYEVMYFMCFLMIAKGWCILREDLTSLEWRQIVVILTSLGLMDALITVFRGYLGSYYYPLTDAMYGGMMLIIVYFVRDNLKLLNGKLRALHLEQDYETVHNTMMQYRLLVKSLVLIVAFLVFEIVAHSSLSSNTIPVWQSAMIHEAVEFILFVCIGGLVHVQESPSIYSFTPDLQGSPIIPTILTADFNLVGNTTPMMCESIHRDLLAATEGISKTTDCHMASITCRLVEWGRWWLILPTLPSPGRERRKSSGDLKTMIVISNPGSDLAVGYVKQLDD